MGGGTEINVPGPTATEQALQQEQVELLRQQRDVLSRQLREQQLLAPFLFEEAGVEPQIDPETGEIIGFEEAPDPTEALREEIERGFLERTQAALEGELPINPALARELEEGEEELRERLRKQLGPGFEVSSPGIEALAEFGKRATELRESARRGDLTLAEQLGLAREEANQARIDQFIQRLGGISGRGLPLAGGFGSTAAGFQGPLGNLASQRTLRAEANIARAQARAETLGGLFGGIGQTLGGAAGIAAPLIFD